MPWHSIFDVFKYFSTPFYGSFLLTYTTKINQNKKYPNFLPKIIPSNTILLSSLALNSIHSALKLCNVVFSIKQLEIIESRLSENDLKFLKTLKMQSLLLNLSLCENYGEIDSILEAVHFTMEFQTLLLPFHFISKGILSHAS